MDKVVERWVTTSKPLESRGLWKRFVQERNQVLPQAKPSKSISDKYQDYLKAESYLEPKSQMFVRDEMGFDNGGRVGFASGTQVIPINDETIEKFRYYIEETDLDKKAIGEKLGYKPTAKGVGGNLRKDSAIVKAYEVKYGEIPEERFKPYRLNIKSPQVQKRLDKVKELGSIKAAAKDLKIDRRGLAKLVAKFNPQLLKDIGAGKPNIPNPDGPYDYSKVRANTIKEMEKVLKKMPGGKKTLDQTISLMDKINAQNKVIATMTDKEILGNKKLINSMRLDVTELKTSKPRLKFDRYKDFTDKQLVKKIRDLAKTNQLFQVEHQIPVSSKRTASLFPKNIQAAVGRVGGQMESMKNFVINNPDSPVVKDIDKFLKNQNVQVKGVGDKNIGYADDIIFDTKKGQSKIVEKGLNISDKKKTPSAMQELMSRTSMGIDPTLLPKAAYQELVKPAAKVAGKTFNVGLGPTGLIGLNAALGVDPTQAMDRIGITGEAALAKPLVQGTLSVTDKIKTPLLRKIAERASLAGMSPAMALRAARIASPLGLASLGAEGLYHLGKAGYKRYKLLEGMDEDQKREFLAQEYEDLGGAAGEGA